MTILELQAILQNTYHRDSTVEFITVDRNIQQPDQIRIKLYTTNQPHGELYALINGHRVQYLNKLNDKAVSAINRFANQSAPEQFSDYKTIELNYAQASAAANAVEHAMQNTNATEQAQLHQVLKAINCQF